MLAKDANGLISSQFARLQVLSTYLAPQEPSEAYSETGQCDCACAEPMLGRLEQFDLSLPIALVAAPDAIALPLTNEHYLLYNPIAGNLAVLNRPALDLWSAYAQANTLDIATSFFARESREIVTRALRQMVSLALLQTVHRHRLLFALPTHQPYRPGSISLINAICAALTATCRTVVPICPLR
jgi:hypothetical protein